MCTQFNRKKKKNILQNWWNKIKNKGKERTNKKRKNKINLKFLFFIV